MCSTDQSNLAHPRGSLGFAIAIRMLSASEVSWERLIVQHRVPFWTWLMNDRSRSLHDCRCSSVEINVSAGPRSPWATSLTTAACSVNAALSAEWWTRSWYDARQEQAIFLRAGRTTLFSLSSPLLRQSHRVGRFQGKSSGGVAAGEVRRRSALPCLALELACR